MAAEILDLEGLAPRIGLRQRLMGADLGSKTIGVALSDVERRIATPLDHDPAHEIFQGRGDARLAHG